MPRRYDKPAHSSDFCGGAHTFVKYLLGIVQVNVALKNKQVCVPPQTSLLYAGLSYRRGIDQTRRCHRQKK
jgi:hypothetical protein